MEMGKLTAKLRDAVPVCLLVDGKEIKRYRNIEIPNELKKLEYQDFKFDVPLNGSITFKVMFEPGVLPEKFPQTRERRTRKPLVHEAQPEEAAPVVEVAVETDPQPLEEQLTEALPVPVVEEFSQALEDANTTDDPVVNIAAAMVNGDEVSENSSEGQQLWITTGPESTETKAQAENDVPTKKPVGKGKGKNCVASTNNADK